MNWHSLIYWLTIKPRLRRLKRLFPEAIIFPAGSRYVCDPPVLYSDIDFLIYSPDLVAGRLLVAGYVRSPFKEYAPNSYNNFESWRRGKVNLIVTPSLALAKSFWVATHIVKRWNLRTKWQRILVYTVLRGEQFSDELMTDYLPPDLISLLHSLIGPHRLAMLAAYKSKYGEKDDWE